MRCPIKSCKRKGNPNNCVSKRLNQEHGVPFSKSKDGELHFCSVHFEEMYQMYYTVKVLLKNNIRECVESINIMFEPMVIGCSMACRVIETRSDKIKRLIKREYMTGDIMVSPMILNTINSMLPPSQIRETIYLASIELESRKEFQGKLDTDRIVASGHNYWIRNLDAMIYECKYEIDEYEKYYPEIITGYDLVRSHNELRQAMRKNKRENKLIGAKCEAYIRAQVKEYLKKHPRSRPTRRAAH